nr:hypothetical protein DBT41_11735 [Aerococcus urinae]
MNPYATICAVIAIVISFCAGWTVHGWKFGSDLHDSEIKQYSDAFPAEQMLADEKLARDKAERDVLSEIKPYVEKTAAFCGLRADGVRLFDQFRMQAAEQPPH